MKVGDLVVPKDEYQDWVPNLDEVIAGIVIDFDKGDPIVFWNENLNEELEYVHQLEVLNV